MQITQSNPDALHFDFGSGRAIYLQLAEKLELLIVTGIFEPGEKLPPIRELALRSKVNPNTLQKSLSLLEDKRLISTDRTNGKFVTANTDLLNSEKEKLARETARTFLLEMAELGFSKKNIINFLNSLGETDAK